MDHVKDKRTATFVRRNDDERRASLKLQIMSAREGHTTLATPEKSMQEIEAEFNRLVGEGYLGFTASAEGATGTMTRSFDPEAAEIVMTPPMVGG